MESIPRNRSYSQLQKLVTACHGNEMHKEIGAQLQYGILWNCTKTTWIRNPVALRPSKMGFIESVICQDGKSRRQMPNFELARSLPTWSHATGGKSKLSPLTCHIYTCVLFDGDQSAEGYYTHLSHCAWYKPVVWGLIWLIDWLGYLGV